MSSALGRVKARRGGAGGQHGKGGFLWQGHPGPPLH